MITIEHVTLIGCGGSGSMLMPALAPAYHMRLYDGDDYEERNIERQISAVGNIGKNKAEVMKAKHETPLRQIEAVPQMITGGETLETDIIICCVDNNDARMAARALAVEHEVPLIVCGNETWDPMAMLWMPQFLHTNRDPYERWKLGQLTEGRQESCTGVEIIEENEQLPAANHLAGGYALNIMESLTRCQNPENYIAEAMSTPCPMFKNVKQIPIII